MIDYLCCEIIEIGSLRAVNIGEGYGEGNGVLRSFLFRESCSGKGYGYAFPDVYTKTSSKFTIRHKTANKGIEEKLRVEKKLFSKKVIFAFSGRGLGTIPLQGVLKVDKYEQDRLLKI